MGPGDVISYHEMCAHERTSLQRGMHYRLHRTHSVVLMSVRPGAPYNDRVEDEGRTLIYEGHDAPRTTGTPDPKIVDQPMLTPNDTLTQNGLFYMAAERARNNEGPPEPVRVYEKVRSGIWVYNGLFELVDAWQEESQGRQVFKFKLEVAEDRADIARPADGNIGHPRVIPGNVKLEVWKRDKGLCTRCGSTDNLHFDHIIPYSRGGSSLTANNIQLLCARHNFEKRDRIE